MNVQVVIKIERERRRRRRQPTARPSQLLFLMYSQSALTSSQWPNHSNFPKHNQNAVFPRPVSLYRSTLNFNLYVYFSHSLIPFLFPFVKRLMLPSSSIFTLTHTPITLMMFYDCEWFNGVFERMKIAGTRYYLNKAITPHR